MLGTRACSVWLAVALLASRVRALDQYIEDADRFPGWRGELPASTMELHESVGYGELGKELWRGRMEQVSWRPRAFLFHHLLSDDECDHLIALGEGHMTKSTVVDSTTGASVDSTVRTSSGTFLRVHQDEVVERIEKRLAHITMIPEENGESLQLLKYVNGQKYEPHTDYFHDKVNSDPAHGGQRVATVLMYLTTPEEGGETVFPYADQKSDGPEWSECARKGLAVKAIKGNALLFYGLKPDGTDDPSSTHGSCPTLAGTKWSATKWIHVGAFNKELKQVGGCADNHDRCEEWAVAGECEKNPEYMSVTCALSCKKCQPVVLRPSKAKLGRRGGGEAT